MKKELIVLGMFIILTVILLSCTLSGDVVVNTRDSFRFISPDLEPAIRTHVKNCDEDDSDCENSVKSED